MQMMGFFRDLPPALLISLIICAALIIILLVRRIIYAFFYLGNRRRRRIRTEAMEEVDDMDGREFEEWCADLLISNGFINVRGTPASGDQGVDITAQKDDVKYAFQCKCYTSDLGNTPVQEVFAGKCMYDCHVGVVMSNRHFTSGAKVLAEKTGVLLWDRDKLASMSRFAVRS